MTSATRLTRTPIRARKKIPANVDPATAPAPNRPSTARSESSAPRPARMATTRPTTLASRLTFTGGSLAKGGLTSVSSAAMFPPSELLGVIVNRSDSTRGAGAFAGAHAPPLPDVDHDRKPVASERPQAPLDAGLIATDCGDRSHVARGS